MTKKRNTDPDGKFGSVLDTALAKKLEGLADEEMIRVLIKMRKKPQTTRTRSGESVVKTLKKEAKQSQKPVIGYLEEERKSTASERSGTEEIRYRSFWLVNLVSARLHKAQVLAIAKMSGVAEICEDRFFHVYPAGAGTEQKPVWNNIGFVRAPEAWALGYRGQNVKVAVIDTGVDIEHPELQGAMGGEPPYYEGYWIEFDENGNPVPGSKPHDSDTHGTHVSGTAVGRNVNMRIGMAPEAVLGHILALPEGSGTLPQLIAGMQWAAENGFQVVNGSWGGSGLSEEFAEAVANLAAAGVYPVFAIGNDGPGETGAPGNTPLAEGVGAFDSHGVVAEFSGGGIVEYPNTPYPDRAETIKPDISAPGVAITSAVPGGGYEAYSGTSMASPHVAGAAAILLSKNPDLSVAEIRRILRESVGGMIGQANDPGEKGKDTRYGWGRLNALKAVRLVASPPSSGIIQGYVQGENEFLAGAAVTFEGPEKKTLTTDRHGFYEGILIEGEYRITVKAIAYQPVTAECPIASEERTIRNFILQAAPLGYVEGTVRDTVTREPLADVTVAIPDSTVITRTDTEGQFALALREGKYSIRFRRPGYFPAALCGVEVQPDRTTVADVEMTFGKATFHGTVLDQTAQRPLPYAWVEAADVRIKTLADREGRFSLDLPAGTHRLEIQLTGYRTLSQTVEIRHGQVGEGRFLLEQLPGTFLLTSSFDSQEDWEGWEAEGGWHLTERHCVTPPNSVWNGDESTGEYPNHQKAVLRRRDPLPIPETGTTVCSVHWRGECERNYDFFYVILLDGEQETELYRYANPAERWECLNLDLTAYAGREIVLAFEFTSDFSVRGEGIFIDNVNVFHTEG